MSNALVRVSIDQDWVLLDEAMHLPGNGDLLIAKIETQNDVASESKIGFFRRCIQRVTPTFWRFPPFEKGSR